MNAQELGKRLVAVAEEWPLGARVWHRADGKRGVICEYAIDGQGCVMLLVCFGGGQAWDKCEVYELSAVRITDGSDGEEWKDLGGEEGAGV